MHPLHDASMPDPSMRDPSMRGPSLRDQRPPAPGWHFPLRVGNGHLAAHCTIEMARPRA